MTQISVNGTEFEAMGSARLIEAINRAGVQLPEVCYHPQRRPIETCITYRLGQRRIRSCLRAIGRARYEGLPDRARKLRPHGPKRLSAFSETMSSEERDRRVGDNEYLSLIRARRFSGR
jgi:hypothetical protein